MLLQLGDVINIASYKR